MRAWIKDNIGLKAWGIFAFTTIMSIWGWAKLGTDVTNAYRLFPLFGLIAFSTMWGHYIVWALREWTGADSKKTALYSKVTQWVVLVSLLAHPILLITRLQADGLGFPPESYTAYVGESLVKFVLLGILSLMAFIAYEFKKWIQRNELAWKIVLGLNHVAMIGVLVHAMQLGYSVKQVPLKFLFPLYGLSLLAVYAYLASKKKLV